MADELDALLERVDDDGLRAELHDHIERLRRKRQFGLVFESHLPERVRLPDHPIRRGSKVVRRAAPPSGMPQEVLRVKDKRVVLAAQAGGEEEVAHDDLVVVAEFGEPVYPGLRRLGSLDGGGDKPAHIVIKGENYHALEALRFSHAGKVDCIYIDPPYNTGARDWKYDNNYVDEQDAYRHSKWLAFMKRRLQLAKDLLNPGRSVLICAIDENEVHRLSLLMEQLFADCKIQMVTVLVNPAGASIIDQFSRVDDHLLFVHIGEARPQKTIADTTPLVGQPVAKKRAVNWESVQRRGGNSRRQDTKAKFFPIYINESEQRIDGCGDHLSLDEARDSAPPPPVGCVAQWPIKKDGTEACWQVSAPTFRRYLDEGRVRLGRRGSNGRWGMSYLTKGHMAAISRGEVDVVGNDTNGAMIVALSDTVSQTRVGKTMWTDGRYNASEHGSSLLRQFIPRRKFPFPKSLYAVEDAIRFYVADNPEAVVLDYFAGSGTTAHAVARLNRQDSGQRQSISITNNEVSVEEAVALRARGLRPGDAEWEESGIFEQITRPRIAAAITGKTPEGEPIEADYRFIDEFPMSEGFEENVEFLELKYLDIEEVELDLAFESVASLLWLRAGGTGRVIEQRCDDSGAPKPFELTDHYGVLFDPDHWRAFVEELPDTVTTVFVVTDSPSVFASVSAELPTRSDVVRLYENYLSTFAINRGR